MAKTEDEDSLWDGTRTDKFISLDLDSTLVYTFTSIKSLSKINIKNSILRKRIYTIDLHDVVNTPGTGIYSRMWGVYRTGWSRFHDFCRKYFKGIIVWSAGQPRYVDAVVDVLFPSPDFQPIIIYNYNHCKINGDTIHKPLEMLYKELKDKGVDATNTYHLDDREDTFSLNKGNGILIPAYTLKPNEKSILNEDTALLQLEKWLSQKEVALVPDVRKLKKNNIFSRKVIIITKKST